MELLPSFDVERRFDRAATYNWMSDWWTQCFLIATLYVVLVHWGQWKMKDRKKFVLRRPLFLWNLMLAIFSAVGFYRVGVPFLRDWQRYGWHATTCRVDWLEGRTGLWCFLMALSKVPELVDTLFVVLRKQKLIFLHWYHHCTVYCFCWYSYGTPNGHNCIFLVLNYFVHMLMYSYYAIRAQGFVKIPSFVRLGITGLQLSQMLCGVYACIYAFVMLQKGIPCHAEYENIVVSLLMYLSYAVLFGHFFYVNYVKKQDKEKSS